MGELGEVVRAASSGSESAITKIYGLEPNAQFHPQLLSAAKSAGLADVYESVAVRAQDLRDVLGLERGSVDSVVTVHVLCSVGEEAGEVVRALYEVLKPGGTWVVYEHVRGRRGVVRGVQGESSSHVFVGCISWMFR